MEYKREFNKLGKSPKHVRFSNNMAEFLLYLLDSICIGDDGWFIDKESVSSKKLDKFDYFDFVDTYYRLKLSKRFNDYDANFVKKILYIRKKKMMQLCKVIK